MKLGEIAHHARVPDALGKKTFGRNKIEVIHPVGLLHELGLAFTFGKAAGVQADEIAVVRVPA